MVRLAAPFGSGGSHPRGVALSKIVRIPKDFVILVCDANKALILKNIGPAAQPELHVDDSIENELDEGSEGTAAPPGRRFDGAATAISGGSRSAMEAPDLERKRADGFAKKIVVALVHRNAKTPIGGLVLVAPPSFLGILRQKVTEELRVLIRVEVGKELAEMPVAAIQKVLLKSL